MKIKKILNTPIILEKLPGKYWKVDEDIITTIETEKYGVIRVYTKKGFVFDLGSIPKFAQAWIDRANDNTVPFIIHDSGFVYGGFTQDFWDKLLYESLRYKGMGYIKAKTVYYAVKWFGKSEYDNSSEDEKRLIRVTWDDR